MTGELLEFVDAHESGEARQLVSVIIPAYNAARYLPATVESALAQTYSPLEIIAVNDGSTDSTASILASFGSRLHTVSQPNAGLAMARNAGIAAAKGDYLAFLDADDLWDPVKTTAQVSYLVKQPECAFVHTGRHVIDANGSVLRSMDLPALEGLALQQLVARNVITASSVMVRRSALGNERFTRLRAVEDWDLWLRLASIGPIGYINQPLTYYRVHDSNMSRDSRVMFESMLEVFDAFLKRGCSQSVRLAAHESRRTILLTLAHLAFERGSIGEARRYFRRAGRPWTRQNLARYVSTFAPAWLHAPVRSAYRSARRQSETS